jgi:hypothetical protein
VQHDGLFSQIAQTLCHDHTHGGTVAPRFRKAF